MCGIAAVLNGSLCEVVRMGNAIKHRGITSNITEVDNLKVYFTLLPITDKSAPIQPYRCGKYYIWLNGYISNYKKLALKYGISLDTECDTELLAKFIEKHSLTKLNELNGFFAVLVYDGSKVHTFTDRYGIKQLYTITKGNTQYYASEVKALRAVIDLELDNVSVDDWHYSLGVMNDHTIYKDVKRVPCLPFEYPDQIEISYNEAKEHLSYLLRQSVHRNKVHGLSDGVFLSGGVDSGTLARFLHPEFSFSVDYQDNSYSESDNIKLNSTGHHLSIICNESLREKYSRKTIHALDDLKAGSCYTNFALTELASKFCTVIYSGDGGDEVFDGYTHRYDRAIINVIKRSNANHFIDYAITHKEYDWRFLKAILVVEDRMSGFHTMETRYPLLDNDFVDFALSLPSEYRKGKRILKDISGLPDQIINGKKKGFSNPYFTNSDWTKFALDETRSMLHRI
jgi:asparagine synthase (glutamine-hydrolysing)